MNATSEVTLLTAPEEANQLGEVPQLYRTDADDAVQLHPLFARAVAACRERWRIRELVVQSQTVDLRSGTHPGIPEPQTVGDEPNGEVAIACLGSEALLVCGGRRCPPDALAFVACGNTLHFAAASTPGVAVVLRISADRDRGVSQRRRHCGRVFAPMPPLRRPLPAWAFRRDLQFSSGFEVEAEVPPFSQQQVAEEPVFAAAATDELLRHGGPIAKSFVAALPAAWRAHGADVIVQVKRDELSPGWYPELINWHMDGTSRANRRSDDSVDLRNPGRKVEQLLLCVGPASPTAMLIGDVRLPEPPLGLAPGAAAGIWQRLLLDDLAAGALTVTTVPERRLCRFHWGAFHTATRSQAPGWRLFVKAMRGRGDRPRNERPRRAAITWPLGQRPLPDDPCGVFPEF